MVLMPKRIKYRKAQRGSRKGLSLKASQLNFGEYGLQALENAWITNTQIEAARVALTRHTQRGGKAWIRIFPDKSVTKKPAETRMGKGKGMPDHWGSVVKRARILWVIEGVPKDLAMEAMRLAAHKLPIRTKFIFREKH